MLILPKRNSGQALLLVLLSMAVVLTVVLAIVSRSVTDISVTTGGEDSLRAFSAAEAGVEKALVAGPGNGSLDNANFITQVDYGYASGLKSFLYPASLTSGEEVYIWFVDHDASGNPTCATGNCFVAKGKKIKICWGKSGTSSTSPTTPALEVSIFYKDSGIKIARGAYDPSTPRTSLNSFSDPDAGTCTIAGTTLEFQKTLELNQPPWNLPAPAFTSQDVLQYAVVRSLYNTDKSHPLGIDVSFGANTALPSQGVKIDSQGSSGQANRRVEVIQGYAQLPEVFGGAVFGLEGVSQ